MPGRRIELKANISFPWWEEKGRILGRVVEGGREGRSWQEENIMETIWKTFWRGGKHQKNTEQRERQGDEGFRKRNYNESIKIARRTWAWYPSSKAKLCPERCCPGDPLQKVLSGGPWADGSPGMHAKESLHCAGSMWPEAQDFRQAQWADRKFPSGNIILA